MDNFLTSKRARDNYIDVLKGIAILLVILVHFDQKWPAPIGFISRITAIGARAPQFFFVTSSFLTWKSIDKHGMDFRRFYISRARRILPLYYVALVIAMFVPQITFSEYSIGNIVGHFLLLHGFNPYWINTIMGVGWYVGDLAIFYLICPLLFRVIKGLKSALLCLAISIVISSLSLVLWIQLNVDNAEELEMFFNTFFFIHQLPVLCLGVVLYYIVKQIEHGKFTIRTVLLYATVIALSFLTAFVLFHLNKRLFTSSLASGIVFSWVFLLCYSIREKFFCSVFTPLTSLGKHSYGIYLFHFTIISCLLLVQHNEHKMMQWIMFYFISILVSAVVSLALECKFRGNGMSVPL